MTKLTTVALSCLLLMASACGDKSAPADAAPSASAAAKSKSKNGGVVAITGDVTDAIDFDAGFVERRDTRTSITLLGKCKVMTCEDVGDFNEWKSKCPDGKRVEVWLEDAKAGTPLPTGPLGKPRVWVRYDTKPDVQDDLFFDKGFEITKADAKTVTGTFSIVYDKPEIGATSAMKIKGGSLKGDFEAEICPPRD